MDIGAVIIWTRPAAQIPAGWQIADGTNGTMDFTGAFIRGASDDGDLGVTAGNDSQDHTFDAGNHTHDTTIGAPQTVQASGANARINQTRIQGTTDASDNKPFHNQAYYIQKVA